MITRNELRETGEFIKPHGIKGELSATFDPCVDMSQLKCVIVDIDGLFVPFFVEGMRRRGPESVLLTIDGIEDEQQAKLLARKTIFMRRDDPALTDEDDEDTEDGLYASDMIGYSVLSTDGALIGRIEDVDDSTENVLFVVERDGADEPVLIPVADEFIEGVDPESRTVTMSLPDGLI